MRKPSRFATPEQLVKGYKFDRKVTPGLGKTGDFARYVKLFISKPTMFRGWV